MADQQMVRIILHIDRDAPKRERAGVRA